MMPLFSIITVLYKKEKQLPFFLESISNQTSNDPIEIICVDDQSPDNSIRIIEEFAGKTGRTKRVETIVIRNEKNLGNCVSRNRGISKAAGDFLIIIDADCLLSANFLEEYKACFEQGADVVVSNFGLELRNRPVKETLRSYEDDLNLVIKDRKIQDKEQVDSFLNCVTRGVALRRSFIPDSLYDPRFTYSASKDSGFGWEDIDAGYRLFAKGARISFAPKAFSLHMTHESSTDRQTKFLKSLKNYRRLHEKHPDIYLLKKEWSLDTYSRICFQLLLAKKYGFNKDAAFLNKHLKTGIFFHCAVVWKYLESRFKKISKKYNILR